MSYSRIRVQAVCKTLFTLSAAVLFSNILYADTLTTVDFEEFPTGHVTSDFLSEKGIIDISITGNGMPLEVLPEQSGASSNYLNPGFGNFLGQINTPNFARTMTFTFAPDLKRFAFRRIGGSNLSSAPYWTASALDQDGNAIDVPFDEAGSGFFLLRDPASFELLAPEGKSIASFSFHTSSQSSTFGVPPIDDIEMQFSSIPEPTGAGLVLAGLMGLLYRRRLKSN